MYKEDENLNINDMQTYLYPDYEDLPPLREEICAAINRIKDRKAQDMIISIQKQ